MKSIQKLYLLCCLLIIWLCLFHPVKTTSQAIGSCDFEETSLDPGNKLCGYTHESLDNDDFFNWKLENDGANHYMNVKTDEHLLGQKARLYSVEIRQRDTHCFTFQYQLEGGVSGNSSVSANSLQVYVLDKENSNLLLPVWTSTPDGNQSGWTTVQLALNPRVYQVVFEAEVLESTPGGVIALDNIIVDNKPCVSTPHFLRVGNKEVNAGQNVTLHCLLWGHDLAWWERNGTSPIVLQKYTGEEFPPSFEKIFDDHLSVEFMFPKSDHNTEGRYRCVSRNATSVGVSNFAKISVKIPPVPQRPPEVKVPGSTRLKIHLNNESFVGDKPIIQTILSYRPTSGSWSDLHEITSSEYLLYHLQPDSRYEIRVTLVRPGPGGVGAAGPVLITKTHCGVPLRSVQNVKLQPIASSEIKITWDVPDFSITQCHYHSYVIKYRKYTSSNETSSAVQYNRLKVKDVDFALITDLGPYTKYEIKVELVNSNGSIETGTYTMMTGEGAPGKIPQESFIVTFTNETAISLRWNEPEVKNGILEKYEVAYRGMSSFQPDFTPQQDQGLYQIRAEEHNITISPLHPGTSYTLMIRAQTGAGFGESIETTASTKIAAPKMRVYPSPTPDDGSSSTPTTIEIDILPAEANGAPISFYYIVIEEVPDEPDVSQEADSEANAKKHKNGSRSNKKHKRNRKRQKRDVDAVFKSFVRVKRQTVVTTGEPDNSPCHAEPISYEDAKAQNKSFYFGGKLSPESVTEGTKYVVGEGSSADGFSNPPLDPNKKYNIYIRVDSELGGDTKVNCALVAIKASVPQTTTATTTLATTPETIVDSTKSETDPDRSSTPDHTVDAGHVDGIDKVVMYASIGGGVVIALIFVFIVVLVVKMRKRAKMRQKDKVVNPFEVRMMMSDMVGSGNSYSIPRSFGNPDRQALMMPDVVDFENHDFMEKTLDASGTRVSGTFRSGSTPLAEDRPALRVDDFHIHVNDMKRQNNFGFHEEFTSFREDQQAPWDVGRRDENRVKNRYGNIMAYDHSRVILQPVKGQEDQLQGDYINANYIMGYKTPQMYIAAQAPSADTVNDFWSMIWQETSHVIVMVTNLVELGKRKCHKYWPEETGQFGAIKVSLTDTEELSHYTIRTFIIQQNDGYDAREVKQFHFTAWPDHGVPSRPTNIFSFVRRVKSYEPPGQGPTTVHCSAGSGRTGCFIVIDMMLDMAREEGVIDIYNTVTDLRSRRVNMVQTEEQYIFIHDSVLEALLCGDTLVEAQDLRQHYDDLITVDQQSQIAPVQEEFETLNVMTPKLTDDECSVARLPRNRPRNRFMDVLPADRQMPYLVTPQPSDPESNYINAIFADSYSKRNAFVVTQMPLPNTVIDFWRLIYDYNCSSLVMMNDASEHDKTCCQYWPNSGSAIFGPFTVELVQKEDELDVVTRLFKLQNVNRPSEGFRFVQQFQLTNWPATQPVPYTRNAVLRVIQLVTKWQGEYFTPGEGRILVHCVAGAGRSGTFVACFNLCMQLRREAAVDVFNIVQRLRNVRPQLIETLEQYRFCYEVGWDFADQ